METETKKQESKYTNGEGFVAICELFLELTREEDGGFGNSNPEHIVEYKAKLKEQFDNLPETANTRTKLALLMNLMSISVEDYFKGCNDKAKIALDLLSVLIVSRIN